MVNNIFGLAEKELLLFPLDGTLSRPLKTVNIKTNFIRGDHSVVITEEDFTAFYRFL